MFTPPRSREGFDLDQPRHRQAERHDHEGNEERDDGPVARVVLEEGTHYPVRRVMRECILRVVDQGVCDHDRQTSQIGPDERVELGRRVDGLHTLLGYINPAQANNVIFLLILTNIIFVIYMGDFVVVLEISWCKNLGLSISKFIPQ